MNAIVTSPVCPLRTEAFAGAPCADECLLGWPVDIMCEPERGRLQVKTHYRYEGYLSARHVLTGVGATARWEERKKYIVTAPFCDVLTRPDIRAPCVETLVRGSLIAVCGAGDKDGFLPVLLPDGRRGHAFGTQLTPPRDDAEKADAHAMREAVITSACSYLGTPYRWGGKTPMGIDCSGLTFMAYFLNGVRIFRDARIERGFPVHEIAQQEIQPADLIFFTGHVALYLGDDSFIHATAQGGKGVVIESLDANSPHYRDDLARSFVAVGSVF
ncbi:MAG: C40 family peptidase [Oscillospiraceae bacterium]|nr:C40 family peptidase [Oscillospiraceae bacterium]